MLSSSPLEYKEALGILADSHFYIDHIEEAVVSKILPKLAQTNSMLDVGAGMGIIASRLKGKFKEIAAIDINPEVEKDLKAYNFNVEIVNFLEFNPERKYDLVICSHVMYHFTEREMKLFIDKLLSLVNPGGYCFITLIAPRGRNHTFHVQYNPEYVNSHQIISVLDNNQVPYEVIAGKPAPMKTNQLHKMKSLLKFFLIENCQRNRSHLLSPAEMQRIDALSQTEAVQSQIGDSFIWEQEDDYVAIAYCQALKQALTLPSLKVSTLIQLITIPVLGVTGVSIPHTTRLRRVI